MVYQKMFLLKVAIDPKPYKSVKPAKRSEAMMFFFASEFPIHPLDRHFPHGHDGELYLTEGPHPLHTGD